MLALGTSARPRGLDGVGGIRLNCDRLRADEFDPLDADLR